MAGELVTPEAMQAAWDADRAWVDSLDRERGGSWGSVPEAQLRRLLEGAAPVIRAAVLDELGHDHFVIFTDDGWTVEHSVDCRLAGDMAANCAYWNALKRADVTDEPDPDMLGRWRITDIDSEGLPSLEREEAPGAR